MQNPVGKSNSRKYFGNKSRAHSFVKNQNMSVVTVKRAQNTLAVTHNKHLFESITTMKRIECH